MQVGHDPRPCWTSESTPLLRRVTVFFCTMAFLDSNRRRCELAKLLRHDAGFAGWAVAFRCRDRGSLHQRRERRHTLRGRNVVYTFTDPRTGDLNNSADLYISCRNPAFGANYYSGCLTKLEIYKRALAPKEIQDVFFLARSAGKCKTNCLRRLLLSCATNKIVPCPTNWNFDDPIVSDPCCGTNYIINFSTVTNGKLLFEFLYADWQVTDCFESQLPPAPRR